MCMGGDLPMLPMLAARAAFLIQTSPATKVCTIGLETIRFTATTALAIDIRDLRAQTRLGKVVEHTNDAVNEIWHGKLSQRTGEEDGEGLIRLPGAQGPILLEAVRGGGACGATRRKQTTKAPHQLLFLGWWAFLRVPRTGLPRIPIRPQTKWHRCASQASDAGCAC